ncbi:MAG: hypothetical protein WC792_06470 [Candidatus Micrarchaeia archaeon]|jgi:hypothetical protein
MAKEFTLNKLLRDEGMLREHPVLKTRELQERFRRMDKELAAPHLRSRLVFDEVPGEYLCVLAESRQKLGLLKQTPTVIGHVTGNEFAHMNSCLNGIKHHLQLLHSMEHLPRQLVRMPGKPPKITEYTEKEKHIIRNSLIASSAGKLGYNWEHELMDELRPEDEEDIKVARETAGHLETEYGRLVKALYRVRHTGDLPASFKKKNA